MGWGVEGRRKERRRKGRWIERDMKMEEEGREYLSGRRKS